MYWYTIIPSLWVAFLCSSLDFLRESAVTLYSVRVNNSKVTGNKLRTTNHVYGGKKQHSFTWSGFLDTIIILYALHDQTNAWWLMNSVRERGRWPWLSWTKCHVTQTQRTEIMWPTPTRPSPPKWPTRNTIYGQNNDIKSRVKNERISPALFLHVQCTCRKAAHVHVLWHLLTKPNYYFFFIGKEGFHLHISIAEVSSCYDAALWSDGSGLAHGLKDLSTTSRRNHHIERSCRWGAGGREREN